MGEPLDTERLVGALGEKHAVAILEATMQGPVPARTIIEEKDVPRTTFYRRIDELGDLGLVEEVGEVDLGGSHYTTYRCNVEAIRIAATDDGFVTTVEHRVSPTDRWIEAWSDIRGDE